MQDINYEEKENEIAHRNCLKSDEAIAKRRSLTRIKGCFDYYLDLDTTETA